MTSKLQKTMGNIGTKYLLYMINKILRPNYPITREYLKAANDIFGTSIKALKGKTVRKIGEYIQLEIKIIPDGVLYYCKNVTLTCEIMFVKKIRFCIMISRNIQFGTAEITTDKNNSTVIQSVVNVIRV